MGDRRLFEVEVRFTYYAEAETASKAEEFADEAWRDGGAGVMVKREVVHSDHQLAEGWGPECLVYGSEGDIELGDLLARLPAKAGRAS